MLNLTRIYAISTPKSCQDRKVAAIRDAWDRRRLRVSFMTQIGLVPSSLHKVPVWKFLVAIALLLIFLWPSAPALAWNKSGHMVSGAIAYNELKQLDPKAARAVVTLLKQHPEYESRWAEQLKQSFVTPKERDLYLFMLAARWSDDARDVHEFDQPTWHYVNFPYNPDRPEPPTLPAEPEENILVAFKQNLAVVQSKASKRDRALALCWIFHLVGDVHQPLHTIKLVNTQYPLPDGDRGGTRFYIRVRPDLSTISLHQFWDDLILGSERFQTVRNTAAQLRLRPDHQRSALPELANSQFDRWAMLESFPLAQQQAYRNGTLQGSRDRTNGAALPSDYTTTVNPVAERRIVLAGYRLADLLQQMF